MARKAKDKDTGKVNPGFNDEDEPDDEDIDGKDSDEYSGEGEGDTDDDGEPDDMDGDNKRKPSSKAVGKVAMIEDDELVKGVINKLTRGLAPILKSMVEEAVAPLRKEIKKSVESVATWAEDVQAAQDDLSDRIDAVQKAVEPIAGMSEMVKSVQTQKQAADDEAAKREPAPSGTPLSKSVDPNAPDPKEGVLEKGSPKEPDADTKPDADKLLGWRHTMKKATEVAQKLARDDKARTSAGVALAKAMTDIGGKSFWTAEDETQITKAISDAEGIL